VSKVGSRLNGRRPKLPKRLADHFVQTIVIEHRDRLMRFNCEYVEAAFGGQGRPLVVMDPSEVRDDDLSGVRGRARSGRQRGGALWRGGGQRFR
jgi:predicted site-specific integrase-resolvase